MSVIPRNDPALSGSPHGLPLALLLLAAFAFDGFALSPFPVAPLVGRENDSGASCRVPGETG